MRATNKRIGFRPAKNVANAGLLENSARSGTAAHPVVLFVLGTGRSGTSALTRGLSAVRWYAPGRDEGRRLAQSAWLLGTSRSPQSQPSNREPPRQPAVRPVT